MAQQVVSIPRPLVRANQFVIVLSVLVSWILSIWIKECFFVLLVPFLSGLSGLIFGFNPVIQIARRFLKYPPDTYPQEDAADQRFNQVLASSMLGLSFLGFSLGFPLIGYLFSALVFVAASVALQGFCVGCFIRYQFVKRRAERTKGKVEPPIT